jgi:hypothetical protein
MNDVEIVEPDGFMQPKLYKFRYECLRCGNTYWSRPVKTVPKKDPPCPDKACEAKFELRQMRQEMQNLKAMLAEGRAPAQIGDKAVVKAVDYTAETVMQDFGMTDLKDNIRPGETMAPKLAAPLQKAADNFFNPAAVGKQRGMNAKQVELLGRRAMSGAFRNMAVSPGAVLPKAAPGESPVRLVRAEKLRS